MMDDEKLEQELREATRGLTFMSESDYPVEVVRWSGIDDVTPEFLRGLNGQEASAPVETTGVGEFFRNAASEAEWKSEAERETARRYQKLIGLLKDNLKGLTVYRVGSINIGVYVVGRGTSGDWLGVSTRVVET
jgi:hypothetical protein